MLTFHNLTLGYDRHPAIHHLSLEIPAGEMLAIVGPNGAGKSTLLKAIMGQLKPLQGHISLDGISRAGIAYLPQMSRIDRQFPITVAELVGMGLWQHMGILGRLKKQHHHKIGEALDAVGLSHYADRPISSLSGGQMQRTLFARLYLQDAQLILLDEPFNAIDSRTTEDLLALLRRWHDQGRSILAVLHDNEQVNGLFPKTLMLARELIAYGPTEQVNTPERWLRARERINVLHAAAEICTDAKRKEVA